MRRRMDLQRGSESRRRDTGCDATIYWRWEIKPHFLPDSFRPFFAMFDVTGREGGVSRDFEPLGPFEPFWC